MALVLRRSAPHTAVLVTANRDDPAVQAATEFAAFFRAEFPAVTRTAYLVLRDPDAAEDVAQEAFTQLHRHWAKVSGYDRPGAWVRRVAIRLAVRAARRDQLRDRLLPWLTLPQATTASRDPDLAAALRILPPQQRAAVALYYYEDRPVNEVAVLLGCTPSTAKVHLFKARKRLAALLGETDAEVTDAP